MSLKDLVFIMAKKKKLLDAVYDKVFLSISILTENSYLF